MPACVQENQAYFVNPFVADILDDPGGTG